VPIFFTHGMAELGRIRSLALVEPHVSFTTPADIRHDRARSDFSGEVRVEAKRVAVTTFHP